LPRYRVGDRPCLPRTFFRDPEGPPVGTAGGRVWDRGARLSRGLRGPFPAGGLVIRSCSLPFLKGLLGFGPLLRGTRQKPIRSGNLARRPRKTTRGQGRGDCDQRPMFPVSTNLLKAKKPPAKPSKKKKKTTEQGRANPGPKTLTERKLGDVKGVSKKQGEIRPRGSKSAG